MKHFNVSESTANKIKETGEMRIKEAKYLKKMENEIEVQDWKLVPIVLYLLKDGNYFKTIQQNVYESGYSRYLVKNAREIISDYLKENVK